MSLLEHSLYLCHNTEFRNDYQVEKPNAGQAAFQIQLPYANS
jgi:hypothetical protein